MGYQWVSATNGHVPIQAYPQGREADGQNLFVARAHYSDGIHPGKVRPAFGAANIPFGGQELKVNNYEVLVGAATWERMNSDKGEVPTNAYPAGYEADGTPLYVARANINGGIHPGKVRPGFGGANIPYDGQEKVVTQYEVLIG